MKIKEGGVMDIQKLTKDQAVVISGFTGILCGEFSDFHTDVEKRLGRGVQTFEFGSKEFAAEVKKLYEADFIGMGTVDTEAAKAQAVPEWKDYELEKPNDGQKCLVIFESRDCEDAQRWMCIDEFNEGMFDFIANWEDQCASVALPAGSIISKVRAVCWATTNLSNAPLSFDQFYEAQEPAND